MSNRFINPNPQYFDDNGEMASGGSLEFYLTGTSTPAATYFTSANTPGTENSNPLPLDDAGRPTEEIFLSSTTTYKVVCKDSNGIVLWTRDPVVDPAANVSAAVQVYPGNPNGNVAGNQGTPGGSGASLVWDITNNLLYICTTTGSAATAVWTSTTASLAGQVLITGVSTPSSLTADTTDYDANITGAAVLRQNSTSDVTIKSLQGGVDGRILIYDNISSFTHTFPNDDGTTGTAAMRFSIAGGSVKFLPGETGAFRYDGVINRWKLWAKFNSRHINKLQSLTDAATVAWDMSKGDAATVTITASRTMGAPTNYVIGQFGYLDVAQNGTGGWTLTWNAAFKFPGGLAERPSPGANETTRYLYFVRGTNDIMIRRLWASGLNGIGFYKEYDKGTFTQSADITQAHGLGRYPSLIQAYLQCTSTDLGFAVGDRLDVGSICDGSTGGRAPSLFMSTTNVVLRTGQGTPIVIDGSASFIGNTIDITKWKVILRIYE